MAGRPRLKLDEVGLDARGSARDARGRTGIEAFDARLTKLDADAAQAARRGARACRCRPRPAGRRHRRTGTAGPAAVRVVARRAARTSRRTRRRSADAGGAARRQRVLARAPARRRCSRDSTSGAGAGAVAGAGRVSGDGPLLEATVSGYRSVRVAVADTSARGAADCRQPGRCSPGSRRRCLPGTAATTITLRAPRSSSTSPACSPPCVGSIAAPDAISSGLPARGARHRVVPVPVRRGAPSRAVLGRPGLLPGDGRLGEPGARVSA